MSGHLPLLIAGWELEPEEESYLRTLGQALFLLA